MNAQRRARLVFAITLIAVCSASALMARCVAPQPALVRGL